MSLSRRNFFSDTAVYTAATVILRLRGLITLPLFARFLGVEAYGAFTQLIVSVTLLVPFLSLRLETALVRFVSSEIDIDEIRKRYYSALLVILLSSTIICFVVFLFSDIGAKALFDDVNYEGLVQLGVLLLATSVIYAYILNFFRANRRIKTQSAILFVESVLETLLVLMAIYLGLGVEGAIWAMIVVKGLFIIGLSISIGKRIGWIELEIQKLKEMLNYSIPLTPNSLLSWIVRYADRLIIVQVLGISLVGVYSASYSLGVMIGLLVQPITYVMFPYVSSLWDGGEIEETKRYFTYISRYYIFLAVPTAVGLAFISQPLIRLLATDSFQTSTGLVFWIAIGIVFHGLFQINVYVFHLVKRTVYVTLTLLVGSIVNIILNVLLVPVIGLSGSALATAATFFVMSLIAVSYGRQHIGYRIEWIGIGKVIISSSIMALGLAFFPMGNILFILSACILSAGLYFIVMLLLQAFSKSELLRFRRMFSKEELAKLLT